MFIFHPKILSTTRCHVNTGLPCVLSRKRMHGTTGTHTLHQNPLIMNLHDHQFHSINVSYFHKDEPFFWLPFLSSHRSHTHQCKHWACMVCDVIFAQCYLPTYLGVRDSLCMQKAVQSPARRNRRVENHQSLLPPSLPPTWTTCKIKTEKKSSKITTTTHAYASPT